MGGGIPLPDRDPVSRPGPLIALYQDVIHGVPWGEAYRSLTGIQCRVPVSQSSFTRMSYTACHLPGEYERTYRSLTDATGRLSIAGSSSPSRDTSA